MDGNLEILQSMFERYFASGEKPSKFGLNIVGLDDIPQKIFVDLTFKRVESYCCGEITCHFKPSWNRIKKIAHKNNLELLSPLSIEFNVLIESGAKLETNCSLGLSLSSEQHQYVEVFSE